eukprot:m.297768 g.297768  ORF g.297768 m.297768 type:complete len:1012 (-) comp55171_c0_seq2:436-3471(-)
MHRWLVCAAVLAVAAATQCGSGTVLLDGVCVLIKTLPAPQMNANGPNVSISGYDFLVSSTTDSTSVSVGDLVQTFATLNASTPAAQTAAGSLALSAQANITAVAGQYQQVSADTASYLSSVSDAVTNVWPAAVSSQVAQLQSLSASVPALNSTTYVFITSVLGGISTATSSLSAMDSTTRSGVSAQSTIVSQRPFTYSKSSVDVLVQSRTAAVTAFASSTTNCNSQGMIYNPSLGCVMVTYQLTSNKPTCNSTTTGTLVYDTTNNTAVFCNGSQYVSVVKQDACPITALGLSPSCPVPSCASLKAQVTALPSGSYFIGSNFPAPYVYCNMTANVSLGGDGSAPYLAGYSCLTISLLWAKPSGTYYIRTPNGVRQIFCDQATDSGGWSLAWKHSYLEVGTPSRNMAFFSSFDQPCLNLSSGWCNLPQKAALGSNEQMIVAYNNLTQVYAYKGIANGYLDVNWKSGILNSPVKILDLCTKATSIPPVPNCLTNGFTADIGICGLTFEKLSVTQYAGSCETDRYPAGSDCRWENCAPAFGTHVQQTVAMFLRVPLAASILQAQADQTQPYASCAAVKAARGNVGTGGFYYIAAMTKAVITYCAFTPTSISYGGDGSSIQAASVSCNVLRTIWNKSSGSYWLSSGGVRHVGFCEMTLDSGGWELVWKYSYYENVSPSSSKRFFSQVTVGCTDMTSGFCNVARKTAFGATEQMLAASHVESFVYAYKGLANSQLDSGWYGAVLVNPVLLVDYCPSGNMLPPEPTCGDAGAYCGISFDKWNPGVYINNCDTDRYGNSGSDCRWENCQVDLTASLIFFYFPLTFRFPSFLLFPPRPLNQHCFRGHAADVWGSHADDNGSLSAHAFVDTCCCCVHFLSAIQSCFPVCRNWFVHHHESCDWTADNCVLRHVSGRRRMDADLEALLLPSGHPDANDDDLLKDESIVQRFVANVVQHTGKTAVRSHAADDCRLPRRLHHLCLQGLHQQSDRLVMARLHSSVTDKTCGQVPCQHWCSSRARMR